MVMGAVILFMVFATVLGATLLLVVALGARRTPERARSSRSLEKSTSRTARASTLTPDAAAAATAPAAAGAAPVQAMGPGEGDVSLAS